MNSNLRLNSKEFTSSFMNTLNERSEFMQAKLVSLIKEKYEDRLLHRFDVDVQIPDLDYSYSESETLNEERIDCLRIIALILLLHRFIDSQTETYYNIEFDSVSILDCDYASMYATGSFTLHISENDFRNSELQSLVFWLSRHENAYCRYKRITINKKGLKTEASYYYQLFDFIKNSMKSLES